MAPAGRKVAACKPVRVACSGDWKPRSWMIVVAGHMEQVSGLYRTQKLGAGGEKKKTPARNWDSKSCTRLDKCILKEDKLGGCSRKNKENVERKQLN